MAPQWLVEHSFSQSMLCHRINISKAGMSMFPRHKGTTSKAHKISEAVRQFLAPVHKKRRQTMESCNSESTTDDSAAKQEDSPGSTSMSNNHRKQ